MQDAYPTRRGEPLEPFPRLDPVVHSSARFRWHGPLDECALSRYERDGFLWFEGFFGRERVEPFFDELAALARDSEAMNSDRVIADPANGELRSVFSMHTLSQRFSNLTRDPRILGMVQQLLGSDVYLHQSRINDKFGFQGGGFDWHSDFETWHSEDGMPRMRAVSASILLTENNEFNGPLMLIPGSHQFFVPCIDRTPEDNWKDSLKKQRLGVPEKSALRWLANRGGIQAPKGPPGSLLLFECNTLHASNMNMSPWSRANLFFVYNSVENQMQKPYCGLQPRPEFLATRNRASPLTMRDDAVEPAVPAPINCEAPYEPEMEHNVFTN